MLICEAASLTKSRAREIACVVTISEEITAHRKLVSELFGHSYIPGTFTLAERKYNPAFLDDELSDGYESWIRKTTLSHLQALGHAGLAPVLLTDELTDALGDAVLKVLDSPSRTGLPLCEAITNQQVTDVIWRILKVLLFGDSFYPLHVFEDFNNMGRSLAITLLKRQKMANPVLALWRSIVCGAVGVDIKSQYSAAGPSPVIYPGIIRMINPNGALRDLEGIEREIGARIEEGLAIDFSDEFAREVIDSLGPVSLMFFSDDLIETVFDLAAIQLWLEFNTNLKVTIVPKCGQHANDASFDDVKSLLRQPPFRNLANFEQTRFFVLPGGPAGSGINAYELSPHVLEATASADVVLFKGARAYEMAQGIKKVAYFAFDVLRSYTETLTGLDATACPRVLLRQDPGVESFTDFRARATRKHTLSSGRAIGLARMTALEYIKAIRSQCYSQLVCKARSRDAANAAIMEQAETSGKTFAQIVLEKGSSLPDDA